MTDGVYDEVHGGFGFGDSNGGGTSLMDFSKVFELVIENTSFPKREEHLVTFQSMVAKTHIDYLHLRRCDKGLCKDFKIITRESLATQHRLLVMDVNIMIKRKKRVIKGHPRIRWGALSNEKAQELKGKLMAMGAWRSSGNANGMGSMTVNCIREATREVLGVSKDYSSGHKGD
ncbi:uncharacterized protein [Nicotiana tomentosiformis]|uniref:uncharacterized protein n=1 Tax=Nicotiana tomentosiformis TaxID=4098 RepID=UPI00388CBB2C